MRSYLKRHQRRCLFAHCSRCGSEIQVPPRHRTHGTPRPAHVRLPRLEPLLYSQNLIPNVIRHQRKAAPSMHAHADVLDLLLASTPLARTLAGTRPCPLPSLRLRLRLHLRPSLDGWRSPQQPPHPCLTLLQRRQRPLVARGKGRTGRRRTVPTARLAATPHAQSEGVLR